jgi:UDP-N-acetylmuramoylalanine-D-glutamate ligase
MPPTLDPHWTVYVSALLAPIVAIGAAVIAFLNMRTAKHKIKIDLFEKRLKVFNALYDVIEDAVTPVDFPDEETPDAFLTFVDLSKQVRWLFDEKTVKWVDDNIGTVIQAYSVAQEAHLSAALDEKPQEELDELREKAREQKKKLIRSQHEMSNVFDPHLKLHKL